MTVTSRLHRQKDKERQKRKEIDVRWWPQEPESGGEAQALERKGVMQGKRERWVLLKIPRCDIDGVGAGK